MAAGNHDRQLSTVGPALVILFSLAVGPAAAAPAPAQAWGGEGCADVRSLRGVVDRALEFAPFGDGRGAGAAGFSVAVQHDACGRFAYAVGNRRVQGGKENQVSTRQHVGSMTKPVATALTLILAEQGLLGAKGIDARVAGFFTRAERTALIKGNDPGNELCPATIQAIDRTTLELFEVRAKCPKLKKITVRQLLNGNHGLADYVNEVDRNSNGFIDVVDYLLGDLLKALGIDTLPDTDAAEAFEVLSTTGILKADGARRGGRRRVDFELSFGNTGYQLLGLILERVSGESFDALVKQHVVDPLGLSSMRLVIEAPRRPGGLASEYAITTGAERSGLPGLDETLSGVYPLVDINGHPAIDLFEAGPFAFTNGGGAAGALTVSPDGYVGFFHALVTGGLLSATNQAILEGGFLQVEGTGFEHGFALFRAQGALGTTVSKGGATAGSNCIAIHALADLGGNGATAVACRNSADLFLPNPDTGAPISSADVNDVAVELLQVARP